MIGRIKGLFERILVKLSDKRADKLSNLMVRVKGTCFGRFSFNPIVRPLIKVLDFIIVRTNGNRFIEFELSNICNARCVFCPYPDMLRTDKKFMHMSDVTIESIKKVLPRFHGALVSFTPTTGDTLLHPRWDEFIGEIISLDSVGRATMFTNAIELGSEAVDRLIRLVRSEKGRKFNQLYLSLGGYERESYKRLYQVDRFEKVRANLDILMTRLMKEGIPLGIHLHIKLEKGVKPDMERVLDTYNRMKYPYAYVSHSVAYFSNEAYRRNALIDYLKVGNRPTDRACAYLNKTRFAADGGIWADGCVISEMPNDSSLKLGELKDSNEFIESRRNQLISAWETEGILPLPCQGCTMYRPRA